MKKSTRYTPKTKQQNISFVMTNLTFILNLAVKFSLRVAGANHSPSSSAHLGVKPLLVFCIPRSQRATVQDACTPQLQPEVERVHERVEDPATLPLRFVFLVLCSSSTILVCCFFYDTV